MNSAVSYLVDGSGSVVHQWAGSGAAGLAVYLLPNGHILRTGTVSSPVFGASAGSGGKVEEYDWDGKLVWSYALATDRVLRHHDVAPLPNGNVLMIAWEVKSAAEAIAAGRNPAQLAGSMWPEAIFEVRPRPPSEGEIVWEWHAWDHVVQDFDASRENYGAVGRHAELLDLNYGPQTPDWLHFNAIAYHESLDQIVVSSRTWSEVFVIDHSTTTAEAAGHTGGRSGKGGDVLYRWGNPQTYRAGGPADQRLFDQHGVHWIGPDLPGAGHLLVFNNGGARNYASADEIATPVDERGNYERGEGAAFGPAKAAWSYGESAPAPLVSRIFGGVQRLANGNTLICVSTSGRLVEVTAAGEAVWELNTGELPNAAQGTFRAVRVAPNFEGLRGTELFREAPALVNSASRSGGEHSPGALVTALGTDLPVAAVEVRDSRGITRTARMVSYSRGQIDFEMPAGTAVGPAQATVHTESGAQSADVSVDACAPALFSANGDGKGAGAIVAVRVGRDGAETMEPAFRFDADAGQFVGQEIAVAGEEQVYLVLMGTGIRGAREVSVRIGETTVPVMAFGPQGDFPGLDQVKVGPLPAALSEGGELPVRLVADQDTANTVTVRLAEGRGAAGR